MSCCCSEGADWGGGWWGGLLQEQPKQSTSWAQGTSEQAAAPFLATWDIHGGPAPPPSTSTTRSSSSQKPGVRGLHPMCRRPASHSGDSHTWLLPDWDLSQTGNMAPKPRLSHATWCEHRRSMKSIQSTQEFKPTLNVCRASATHINNDCRKTVLL